MPVGKSRGSKRSSSSGYSSTVTTVIFVVLCVLGVWMLSSDTVAPPKPTTRTAGTTSIHSSSAINADDQEPESRDAEPANKRKQPVFADSEGDLPEDAIKIDNEASNDDHKDESLEVSNDSAEMESSSDAVTEVGSEGNDKQDTGQEIGASEGNGDGKHEVGQDSVTEEKKVDSGQQASEISQISEESTKTQNQESEETKENQSKDSGDTESLQQTGNDQGTSEKQNVEEVKDIHEDSGGNHSQQQSVDGNQVEEEGPKEKNDQVISDEDQQKRLEQHQKQEDDQLRQGQSRKETPQEASKDNNEVNQKVSNKDMDQKDKASASEVKDSVIPAGDSSGIPKESKDSKKSWATQADQSENEKERRKVGTEDETGSIYGYEWQLCNVTAGADYIPCLDNEKAIAKLRSRKHYEHRERHCPEEAPTCLVQLPEGYKKPIEWPHSRDKIWYNNVPHTLLAEVKGHQNWVKVTGEFLTFPGGGTQFIHGALHYIDFIQEALPDIAWGKHTRVVLDVGCGVASFGGYLFDRDVLAVSFAPKDEHEAQVQFALERGIPAISAVMGSQRLPFPSKVFDIVHCARCRVPWHVEGGALLLELNRVLRPGGYFVWSATPVYQKLAEDVEIWNEMSKLTVSMCWELVTIKKDKLNSIGAAVYHKPDSNECYDKRKQNRPPMCKTDDDPNASWYVPLQACMHRVPTEENLRGSEWPEEWPRRLQTPPYWLNRSQMGIYGKPAPEDFAADYEHWKQVVSKTYLSGLGISWSDVRNIMDMRAVYGGFAAALKDLKVWVMNVVNVDSPDTLPIIYERGLIGIYHDWCESFSTYPRTYDLLHADHLFSRLKKRCKLVPVLAEVDRITRPGGKLIVRDDSSTIEETENLLKSLHWEVHMTFSKNQEGILSAQKSNWRPDTYAAPS